MPNSNIEKFQLKPLKESRFVKPIQIEYKQSGVQKVWEAVKSHDSVAILVYHREKEAFLIVKQFRPPVYMNDKNHSLTHELCAGIVDKDTSLKQIAKEEINEECGYDVELENIEEITSFFTNVGVSGSKQSLFFTEIDESMKVHEGGGIHDEQIVLEFIPLEEAKAFIFDTSKAKTPGLMFAFYWFFENFV
ncbi:NUDIX hydrolase [bacterium]|nr:NUDIX hydrolase [bacterium]MBU1958725.1 NUDIX hydrolase [bacterium]